MFSEHQLRWRSLIAVAAVMAAILWSIALLAAGVDPAELAGSLPRLGLLVLAMSAAWWWFTRYGWRQPWLRFGGWLVNTPDLRGRWEGNYVSSFDKTPRPMALEVRRTLLTIDCAGYGPPNPGPANVRGNEARTYCARLLSDPTQNEFRPTSTTPSVMLRPASLANNMMATRCSSWSPEHHRAFTGTTSMTVTRSQERRT